MANITIVQPVPMAEVRSPLQVQGAAVVFEGALEIRVRNARGQEIGQELATATVGAPERGSYSASVRFRWRGEKQNGSVEVFSRSPRDGSIENLVSVPVVLVPE